MEIKNIADKYQWDNWFVQHATITPFTQSWAWGDILIAEGKKVERLAVVESGQVVAQAQVVYTRILFGWQYAFCPKGPIVESSKSEILNPKIYKFLASYLKKKKCIFFRIEPPNNFKVLISDFKKTIDINPSATLILDLSKSESELLAHMHAKTRYNIHLAEKKNLRVSHEKNLDVLWDLMNKTGARDKFRLHHKEHYKKILESAAVSQLTAYQDKNPVACAVFVVFGNTFTYLYGASDYEYRNLMAPYLLQWEGVQMGQDLGCKWYDFFGVAPRCHSEESEESLKPNERDPSVTSLPQDDKYDYDPKHQYGGVTRFKLGFGGAPHQDPGTFDMLVSRSKYAIYTILRRLRRLF